MGRGPTEKYYKVMNDLYIEGTLTCLKPEIIKKHISNEFPLVLNIEPTNACNADCFYCPRKTMIKAQGQSFMSLHVFKQIIDQVGSNQLIMLNLHKDGEPLLNNELPEMIEYAKQKNASKVIHLNTNGILINSKTGRKIIENGIDDITISIDAAYEKTYQALKNVKGLDKLEINIKKALKYRDEIGSSTIIRVKIMEFEKISTAEMELFHKKWQGIADEVQVTGVHDWGGEIDDVEITDEKALKRYPCALLWYMLAINSNGKVSVCNVDWNYSGVIGDIHDNSIHDIWNGQAIKKIRRNHLTGVWNKPDVCENCVVWVSVGDLKTHFESEKKFYE